MEHAEKEQQRILYHYCPAEAFVSIISTRSIRLSALDASNDKLEGRWALRILEEEFEARGIPQDVCSHLLPPVERQSKLVTYLGLCLSEVPDQLSQWRGYANDGRGFAIGFDAKFFEELGSKYRQDFATGFGLHKVCYDKTDANDELGPILESAEEFSKQFPNRLLRIASQMGKYPSNEEGRKAMTAYLSRTAVLMLTAHKLKNPAFREEKEWRVVAITTLGDFAKGKQMDLSLGRHSEFRAASDRLVPYRTVDFLDVGVAPVKEVWLGPKNITRPEYVSALLEKNGFLDAKITNSDASYR